jgi:hypothetical protein
MATKAEIRAKALRRKARQGKQNPEERADNAELNREEKVDNKAATKETERYYGKDGEKVLDRVNEAGTVDQVSVTGQEDAADTEAKQQSEYDRATTGDADTKTALERMKGGLDGFTSAENQALTEQTLAGADSDAKSMMRQLQISSGQSGVAGDALGNQQYKIMRNQAMQRQQGRMEVLAQNVAEKARRLNEYGTFAQSAYKTDTDTRNSALDRLAKTRTGQQEYGLQADKANQEANLAQGAINADAAKFNAGQGNAELAGRVGTFYGSKAARKAARESLRSRRLANRGYDIASAGY